MVCVLDRWILTRWTLVCLPTVQFFAAQASERHFRTEVLWLRLAPTQQVLMRSQSGPFAGLPFLAVPSSPFSRFPPQLFRVLLRRFPCPCLLVPAGVAVHSTSLATTAQRARGQVCAHVDGAALAQARRVNQLSSKLQQKTHPKTLSSKNTFTFFFSKTLSSKNTFVQKHFRPKGKTISSTTLSSKNGFIQ